MQHIIPPLVSNDSYEHPTSIQIPKRTPLGHHNVAARENCNKAVKAISGTCLIPVHLTVDLPAHNVNHINNHLPLPSPTHHQNNCFFHPAQAIKVNQSVPYVYPQTHTIPSSASPRPFGMEAKPGVESPAKEGWSHHPEQPYAVTGMVIADAPIPHTTTDMSVPDVERRIMALRDALEHRKKKALTPYKPDSWEQLLLQYGLLEKYPKLPSLLHCGFDVGIRQILGGYWEGKKCDQKPQVYRGKGLEGRGQGIECLTPHKPLPLSKGKGIPSKFHQRKGHPKKPHYLCNT